ncbi:ATP-binding protein [Sphingomonas sp. ABOLE]|uniref:TrlF family AAA-like ATPase n=1 Tax=Sphingomonas sp. ABOLE TaxID=1985878 RepID=UPI000F7FA1D0|nr:AAA family ATPase [Sphingomonas sp. ABOLE]RSV35785.1 ATP-binding protein [Sphingomonas sp. ABOLE]
MITRGSEWRRWEPHIHAPGTVLNNQFRGPDPWTGYIDALEASSPCIEAIAATDYYVTDTYSQILAYKAAGRLPDVGLIFPNIELRLDVTARKGYVNLHLLVSPEDNNHLVEVGRILKRLHFHAFDDSFDCSRDELIRLGRRANPSLAEDRAALAHGATQFRVNFAQLREVLKGSEWARKHILVAVAGGADDGTSGLRQAADATVRQEIEKFADIIFASSVAQREFWLGRRGVSVDQLQDGYEGCKPCLHGSDAHDHASVGNPIENRYSWIKGAVTFDALRQACIDPAGRAYVGAEPPHTAMPSQVISEIELGNAAWATTPKLPLNPGLVAIIGARGSGKTALADMIAAGADAIPPAAWKADENISPSFLARARSLIGDGSSTLTWGGGTTVTRFLDGRDANSASAFPRARYLSQQFVEELCSSKGASEGLIHEIERVIFEAHPRDQRDGAVNFAQLRDRWTMRFQQARQRESEAISTISERIAEEIEKETLVTSLSNQAAQKRLLIEGYSNDLAKLVVKGTEAQAQRHAQLNAAAQGVNSRIQQYANQRRTFLAMQDEVRSTKVTKAPELLRQAQARHASSGLSAAQWEDFLLVYKGNVEKALQEYIIWADQEIANLRGAPPPPTSNPSVPLVADDADLATLPLALIQAEMHRLEQLISADQVVRGQYNALSARIAQENSELQGIDSCLLDAQGAAARRKDLQVERDEAYARIFEAIINEQNALAKLYAPLMARLAAAPGTLGKLSFSVGRVVDVRRWGAFAEDNLIDCRKSGPFFGRGSLIDLAETTFRTPWETGSSSDVQIAMSGFIAAHTRDLFAHAPFAQSQRAEFRSWSKSFAHWLFSTDHISVRYEIRYDGIDIRKLSPGTRGIVLLLLYLALDDGDDRPLIIDQPEENLDPKSVFDELVSLFISAKSKRQVIMVTHNANLVINTDADQIIIAECGTHQSGGLPPITYVAGGLEDEHIRKAVCDILEGGEQAFRERARRLRVRLKR